MDDEENPDIEHELSNLLTCPMCQCVNAPLGGLGNLIHYSCRDCGAGYSFEVEPETDDEQMERERRAEERRSNRVDGYDSDNLGESPDH